MSNTSRSLLSTDTCQHTISISAKLLDYAAECSSARKERADSRMYMSIERKRQNLALLESG